jgi:predicted HAD superfamily Cof-like phosphohydrolase
MLSEEYTEVLNAFGYDDIETFMYIKEQIDPESHEQMLKELVDLSIIILGTCDAFGWDYDEAAKRVVESNMTKLDSEGNPIFRDDGKVLKSDRYCPPDLSDLV